MSLDGNIIINNNNNSNNNNYYYYSNNNNSSNITFKETSAENPFGRQIKLLLRKDS